MWEFSLGFTILGAFVLITGFFSARIEEHWFLSRPALALALGWLIGPFGLKLMAPEQWQQDPEHLLEIACEITMGIAIMGAILRLPKHFIPKQIKPLSVILGLVMPIMALTTAMTTYAALNIPILTAFLIGTVLAPTDPILATSIIQGKIATKNLPDRLRHFLTAEAGANDGLAFPLVYIAILLTTHLSTASALTEWFKYTLMWETLGAALIGVVIGHWSGRLLRSNESHSMEKASILGTTLAITLLIFGLGELIHFNSILSVFSAGVSFNLSVSSKDQQKDQKVQEAINEFFTAPIFIFFGILLPWEEWQQLGMSAFFSVFLILLIRRLPVMTLFYKWMTPVKNIKEAFFSGWFGPMGVAAIYYSLVVKTKTGEDVVWIFTSLVVFSSVIIHGLTSTPAARLMKK